MTEYYIPTGRSETELVEKRSRFIGQVWLVSSEEEARVRIEETRKKHYDAVSMTAAWSAAPTTVSPRAPPVSPCSTCSSGRM